MTTTYGASTDAAHRSFGAAMLNGYLEGRRDHRPPLVLLHGLTFDHRMWQPALAALRRRDPGRQALVLDLPGHGGSPPQSACDVEDVAAAVDSAVEDAGLDAPVVVGHSVGAVVASIYAGAYEARGVVNVDQPLDTGFIHMLRANRETITGPGFPQWWPMILASLHVELLPASAQALLNTGLPSQDVVVAYWRQALESPPAEMEARITAGLAALRHRRLPYAVVAGHDWDAPVLQQLHDNLPQATVTVVPNSGHFPHLADPDRFAQLLADTAQW